MKKLLASLILCLGLIPCFSSALDVYDIDTVNYTFNQTFSSTTATNFYNHTNKNILVCFNGSTNGITVAYKMVDAVITRPNEAFFCIRMNDDYNGNYLRIDINAGKTLNITVSELINPAECPVMSSLQCQTNYNLIPISSVDSNYCESNNLCPVCPDVPDNPNSGTSNLFINDVFHPGAFNVIINIPDEIDWDYAYTNSGNNINIDVVGYNQDTEYINGWIDTNNYKPTSDDFTNMFLLFKDYSGLLIALLFVILVFYFVKKLF